ncbi:putative protein DUF4202 [Leeuwenhoekiella aestuarii]|uniref:DUF4202 domain-containing protein n=1 Tax=Leeuwenhoekiella aestuarii TaxID=2249426 RepID=A0A4Q0NPY6_9FLAO|nr:DUF4202 domain-containing protein [Leeuwenhoekiella aestuarii]RXG11962.1 putative protein DUF4202 [Leeuwenhoekiella aestuarii]RXG13520.1 putative protein DUF4202 [Leeuwenhoekiella aestuarii]
MTKFQQAIKAIDKENSQDSNRELVEGKSYPKELLYSERMTRQLLLFEPKASKELQIAARAQHICRWKSPREDYPMDRIGYLKWREDLKKMHAKLTTNILEQLDFEKDFIDRVQFLIKKKLIKKDEETQTLEDVICLVFLQYYFEDFASKHKGEKVINIIQKTWLKMSKRGQAEALKLPLNDKTLELVNRALA